jgi:zinc transport system ATP-binding protein
LFFVSGRDMSLVQAEHLSVRADGQAILSDVSLSIGPGEIVTIVGPNGSGKTTLLRALLGLIAPSAGTVSRRAGLKVGYVPQRLAIDRSMPLTVARFLSLPVRQSGARIAAILSVVEAEGLERRQLRDLSGGQFQRVLLARALLAEPELLVLDEPTQGLDQMGEAAFYTLLDKIRRESHAAVLMVSHDLHVVMSSTDRVICLNGHICCQGAPSVVSKAPEYRALFGLGTHGALALYRHEHDHDHAHDHAHDHGHHPHQHDHEHV